MSKQQRKPKAKKRRSTRVAKSPATRKKQVRAKTKTDAGYRSPFGSQRFSLFLISFGLAILVISRLIFGLSNRLPVTEALPRVENNQPDPNFMPTQITIATHIDLPIISGDFINQTWTDSKKEAIFYLGSTMPYHQGNTIIYAHNTHNLFGKLKQVKLGDSVSLRLLNEQTRQYQIVEIIEVDPSNTKPLQPSPEERLTLYTCSGWMDSKRLVVIAKPIEADEASLSAASPSRRHDAEIHTRAH